LTEPFALSQQMISKHIAYLVRARIVIKTKRGRESVCTLSSPWQNYEECASGDEVCGTGKMVPSAGESGD
jgi:hypothetical protein